MQFDVSQTSLCTNFARFSGILLLDCSFKVNFSDLRALGYLLAANLCDRDASLERTAHFWWIFDIVFSLYFVSHAEQRLLLVLVRNDNGALGTFSAKS